MIRLRKSKESFIGILVVILILAAAFTFCAAQTDNAQSPSGVAPPVRLEHIGINMADPVATAEWYQKNLGMKIVRRGGAPLQTVFLSDADGNMMFEFFHDEKSPVLEAAKMNPLTMHVAFHVPDIQAMRDKLVAAGATLVDEPKKLPNGDQLAMLRDPAGFPLQLFQRGKPMLNHTGVYLEHFALNLADSRKTAEWFEKNLGMVAMHKGPEPNYQIFLADAGKNSMLEFYQIAAAPALDFDKINPNTFHLAFMTADVPATEKRLLAVGATLAQTMFQTAGGDSLVMLRGPAGVPIQLASRKVPMVK